MIRRGYLLARRDERRFEMLLEAIHGIKPDEPAWLEDEPEGGVQHDAVQTALQDPEYLEMKRHYREARERGER